MSTFEKYVCLIASKLEVRHRCCSFFMICRAFLKLTDKCRQMQTKTCIFVRSVCRLAPPLNRTPNNERNANTKNSHTPLITTRGGRPYRLTTKRTTLICSFVPNNTSKKNIGVLSCCELGFQPKPKRSIRRCIGSLRSKIHKPRYGPVHKEYTTQAMDLFSRTSKPKEKHENKKRWCISVSFERS